MSEFVETIDQSLAEYIESFFVEAARKDLLAALNAAGLVIVERAPTDDMLAAGVQKCPLGPSSFKIARDVYVAMIAASPHD